MLCTLQGKVWCFVDVFISYSYLSSVLWTVAFSFDNFGNLRPKRRNMMDSICAQRMCIFQMLCWLLPGVFVFAELYLSFQTWRNWYGDCCFICCRRPRKGAGHPTLWCPVPCRWLVGWFLMETLLVYPPSPPSPYPR